MSKRKSSTTDVNALGEEEHVEPILSSSFNETVILEDEDEDDSTSTQFENSLPIETVTPSSQHYSIPSELVIKLTEEEEDEDEEEPNSQHRIPIPIPIHPHYDDDFAENEYPRLSLDDDNDNDNESMEEEEEEDTQLLQHVSIALTTVGSNTRKQTTNVQGQGKKSRIDVTVINTSSTIRKPSTAWSLYCSEMRNSVSVNAVDTAALSSTSSTSRLKALAVTYRNLSETDRNRLEALSEVDKARYNNEVALSQANNHANANANDNNNNNLEADVESEPTAGGIAIPLARVKRLCKVDPEVKNIGKEALVSMSKATELFIQYLAASAAKAAANRGVRTIREVDLLSCIHGDDSLTFLSLDFPAVSAMGPPSSVGRQRASSSSSSSRAARRTGAEIGSKGIKDYFGGAGGGNLQPQEAAAHRSGDVDEAEDGEMEMEDRNTYADEEREGDMEVDAELELGIDN